MIYWGVHPSYNYYFTCIMFLGNKRSLFNNFKWVYGYKHSLCWFSIWNLCGRFFHWTLSSYILATYENHEHQTIVICCKNSERVISHMFGACILGFLPVDTVMIKLWLWILVCIFELVLDRIWTLKTHISWSRMVKIVFLPLLSWF